MNTTHVLKALLARRPDISLDEIRASHRCFRSMSMDHLSLHVSRLLDRNEDSSTK